MSREFVAGALDSVRRQAGSSEAREQVVGLLQTALERKLRQDHPELIEEAGTGDPSETPAADRRLREPINFTRGDWPASASRSSTSRPAATASGFVTWTTTGTLPTPPPRPSIRRRIPPA